MEPLQSPFTAYAQQVNFTKNQYQLKNLQTEQINEFFVSIVQHREYC